MSYLAGVLVVALVCACAAAPAPESRIVGGEVAPEGSHPHMVALTNGLMIRSFFCGGSLVSATAVLTAAHCIESVYSFGALSSSLRATVGTARWNQGGEALPVARNVTHALYDSFELKHDLGLLITARAATLSARAHPIPLGEGAVGAGVGATVAGWGRIRDGGAFSAVLLQLSTRTISDAECDAEVSAASQATQMYAPFDPAIEFCTLHSAGNGNCHGDSGSALVRSESGEQIGIVSWGFPCAVGAPDVYVRVGLYADWIRSQLA